MDLAKLRAYEQQLNSELAKYKLFVQLENQLKLPKSYSAGGMLLVYLFLIYLNIGGIGQLFSNIATVLLPGYYSLVALESPEKSDDTQFLTYWVVYAAFTVIEFWSGAITYWIPAYWLIKTVLFLWLGLPAFSGAKYVYDSFLRSFGIKYLGIKQQKE